jgi:hypothetical protein
MALLRAGSFEKALQPTLKTREEAQTIYYTEPAAAA